MSECRFKIRVAKSGLYHCAANVNGWAYLFSEKEDYRNACIGCKKYVPGKPKKVKRELKSIEFWAVAGKLVRAGDWEMFKRLERERCTQ